MICDNIPSSCPRILNYNFGELSHFVDHLLSQKGNITSCDDSILHGDFDQVLKFQCNFLQQGGSSSSILIKYNNQLVVLETHVGVSNTSIDYCGCGYPGRGSLLQGNKRKFHLTE